MPSNAKRKTRATRSQPVSPSPSSPSSFLTPPSSLASHNSAQGHKGKQKYAVDSGSSPGSRGDDLEESGSEGEKSEDDDREAGIDLEEFEREVQRNKDATEDVEDLVDLVDEGGENLLEDEQGQFLLGGGILDPARSNLTDFFVTASVYSSFLRLRELAISIVQCTLFLEFPSSDSLALFPSL